MSNSALVNFTRISPNSSNPRNDKIKKITIHHMAGDLSVETCGSGFANPARQASSNYGIGSDGRIALYVDEANRAWTSGNAANDNQAVTIEVANCGGAPDWKVSDAALASLIKLCIDICRRNDIEKLIYNGSPSGTLTTHKMFQATLCPGPYLESKLNYICQEVNSKLTEYQKNKNDLTTTNKELYRVRKNWNEPSTQKGAFNNFDNAINCAKKCGTSYKVFNSQGKEVWSDAAANVLAVGDKVRVAANARYYNNLAMPQWVKDSDLYVREIKGDRIVISTVPTGAVTGAVHRQYIIQK